MQIARLTPKGDKSFDELSNLFISLEIYFQSINFVIN
ncbi:unnamed protein product [Brugia timori]|uniref:Transcriptional regulator n=1 Tax=Brugia timori TaxID=42155 RepID=A0A0R3QW83_9BILA|nr:unnamed protein product [Brugia timori]